MGLILHGTKALTLFLLISLSGCCGEWPQQCSAAAPAKDAPKMRFTLPLLATLLWAAPLSAQETLDECIDGRLTRPPEPHERHEPTLTWDYTFVSSCEGWVRLSWVERYHYHSHLTDVWALKAYNLETGDLIGNAIGSWNREQAGRLPPGPVVLWCVDTIEGTGRCDNENYRTPAHEGWNELQPSQ